ncbi:MAG: metal-sensitive transcriptional regulator [Patescibacteria group bacterium]
MKVGIKKQVSNRINRIAGQIGGLQKMIDQEKYCVDIITQSSAIRSALSALEDQMLENHLSEHVIHQMQKGESDLAIEEIITIFKKSKKK